MAYHISEVFYSIQGEGVRAGTVNVFIRFAGCNQLCNGQFDEHSGIFQPVCDTDFVSQSEFADAAALLKAAEDLWPIGEASKAVIFTGGEPALQLDAAIIEAFKAAGWYLAIETNGTKQLPSGLDWVCVSPKTAEHTLALSKASELKYVRAAAQPIPRPRLRADFYLLSPHVLPDGTIQARDLLHCVNLVKDNPQWRLTMQFHKLWKVR